ncbi:translation initiation factor IF-2-like [Mustela erminea]|uniref:translation initiation factor IF-2-like n=1 Tax=Mustela erminea TaxID=36723 RepID=UPI0013869E66|nr:translation initiation factor IF-2-like [Mustela erminea]
MWLILDGREFDPHTGHNTFVGSTSPLQPERRILFAPGCTGRPRSPRFSAKGFPGRRWARLACGKNRSSHAVKSPFCVPRPGLRTGRKTEARRQGGTHAAHRPRPRKPLTKNRSFPRAQYPCHPALPGRSALAPEAGPSCAVRRRRALSTTGQRGRAALGGGGIRGGRGGGSGALLAGVSTAAGRAGPGALLPLRPKQVHRPPRWSPTVPARPTDGDALAVIAFILQPSDAARISAVPRRCESTSTDLTGSTFPRLSRPSLCHKAPYSTRRGASAETLPSASQAGPGDGSGTRKPTTAGFTALPPLGLQLGPKPTTCRR